MYRFHVTITPEIYTEFNVYTSTKTAYGKEQIRKFRLIFSAIIAVLLVLTILRDGLSIATLFGFVPALIVWALFVGLWPRILANSLKKSVKSMSKKGKLGYDPQAEFLFYDEHFEEVTSDQRTSIMYTKLERAVVRYGDVVYLYLDSMRAYILPASAFESPQQMAEFVQFLRTKVAHVEDIV